MDTIIMMSPLLVPLVFVLCYAFRRVKCPDCGATLPIFYSPFKKTRRMWRAGGYLCDRCGCETNMAGEKVTADTPPAPFPTLQWAFVGVLLLVGGGLLAAVLIVSGRAAVPPVVAAPQGIDFPQQAPALAPVN
jgi:hypothetical protein